jgi:hypothetical protein
MGWLVTFFGVAILGAIASPALRHKFEAILANGSQALLKWTHGLARRTRILLALVGVGLALVATTLVVLLRGSRDLLVPPVSNPMLSVAAVSGLKRESCRREWWRAQYRCEGSPVLVEPELGASPRGDSTHEYARLWAGARVRIDEQHTTAELLYRRVDARDKEITIEYQTYGGFDVEISVAGETTSKVRLDGTGTKTFSLPATTPRISSLLVRVTARDSYGWVTLRRL